MIYQLLPIVIAFISLYSEEIHLEKAAGIYFVISAIATLPLYYFLHGSKTSSR